MKTELIIDWINCKFAQYAGDINRIAIYGSIARGVTIPHDCDLLIVTLAKVESDAWISLRQHINSMRTDFEKVFGFPLNIAFLTYGEWKENRSFYKDLLQINLS